MVLKLLNYKVKYEGESHWFSYPDIYLDAGKCLAILGKSGIGKTTLINSLFCKDFKGLIEYDEALILERDFSSWGKDIYEYVSYMPQFAQDGLNPSKTIKNQIDLVKSNNISLSEEEVDLYLEDLGLDIGIKKAYPFQISGGMKQRAVLLLSFIKKPKLLVLDEPTSALDYFTSINIIDFLQKRKAEGVGMLIISHDRSFVKELADEVIVL